MTMSELTDVTRRGTNKTKTGPGSLFVNPRDVLNNVVPFEGCMSFLSCFFFHLEFRILEFFCTLQPKGLLVAELY